MSSKARGVGEADIDGKPVELAQPNRLVQLTFDADRVLTYWRRRNGLRRGRPSRS
jgi:hypothetical protein